MKGFLFFLALLSMGSNAFAKDLGVYGKNFPISETDFLVFIQEKMQRLQDSGEWKQIQASFKKRVEEHIARPNPMHLPRAIDDRSWLFDPSLELPYDINDHQGHVIVKAGTVINPLDRVTLHSSLLFFDGDDLEQIAWVREEAKKHEKATLILSSGSVKATTNDLKQAIFFDLNGFLIHKFHIRALPAVVFQEGKRLKINEVRI